MGERDIYYSTDGPRSVDSINPQIADQLRGFVAEPKGSHIDVPESPVGGGSSEVTTKRDVSKDGLVLDDSPLFTIDKPDNPEAARQRSADLLTEAMLDPQTDPEAVMAQAAQSGFVKSRDGVVTPRGVQGEQVLDSYEDKKSEVREAAAPSAPTAESGAPSTGQLRSELHNLGQQIASAKGSLDAAMRDGGEAYVYDRIKTLEARQAEVIAAIEAAKSKEVKVGEVKTEEAVLPVEPEVASPDPSSREEVLLQGLDDGLLRIDEKGRYAASTTEGEEILRRAYSLPDGSGVSTPDNPPISTVTRVSPSHPRPEAIVTDTGEEIRSRTEFAPTDNPDQPRDVAEAIVNEEIADENPEAIPQGPERESLTPVEIERAANEKISQSALGRELLGKIDSLRGEVNAKAPVGRMQGLIYFIGLGGEKAAQYKEARRTLRQAESRLALWQTKEAEYIVGSETAIAAIDRLRSRLQDPDLNPMERRSLYRQATREQVRLHKKRQMIEEHLAPDIKQRFGLTADIDIMQGLGGVPSQAEILNDYEQKQALIQNLHGVNGGRPREFYDATIQLLEQSMDFDRLGYGGIITVRDFLAESIKGDVTEETLTGMEALFGEAGQRLRQEGLDRLEFSRMCALAIGPMFRQVFGQGEALTEENLGRFLKDQSGKSLRRAAEAVKEQLLIDALLTEEGMDPRSFNARRAYRLVELTRTSQRKSRAANIGVMLERKRASMNQLVSQGFQVAEGAIKQNIGDIVGAEMQITDQTRLREIMDQGEGTIATLYQALRTAGVIIDPRNINGPIRLTQQVEGALLSVSEGASNLFGESEALGLWRLNYENRRNETARLLEERLAALQTAARALGETGARSYDGSILEALITRTRGEIANLRSRGNEEPGGENDGGE